MAREVREETGIIEIFREEGCSFWELIIISITFATLSIVVLEGKGSSGGSSAR